MSACNFIPCINLYKGLIPLTYEYKITISITCINLYKGLIQQDMSHLAHYTPLH